MDLIKEVSDIKEMIEQGHNIKFIVNYLATKETYHIVASNILSIVYSNKSDLNKTLYSHPFYFEKKNEKNPFNSDFLNDNSRIKKMKWFDLENQAINHKVYLYECPNNKEHILSYEVIPYKEVYNKAVIVFDCFKCNEKYYMIKGINKKTRHK